MEDRNLTDEEKRLMRLLLNYNAEPTEIADAWVNYFIRDEVEVEKSSREEFERYRNNFYDCLKSIIDRSIY